MRCTLVAIGPRGDIQPMLALGSALAAGGAAVTIATHADFAPAVAARGLAVTVVQGDAARFFGGAAGVAARERLRDGRAFRRFFDDYLSLFYEKLLGEVAAACTGADLVVCWPWTRFATSLAEGLGIPVVIACTYPVMHLPTAAFANPYQPEPGGAEPGRERHSWRLALPAMQAGDAALNRWRQAAFGLPPIGWREDLHRLRRLPHLLAYSETVLARPADWPPNVHVTGYWFVDDAPTYRPPDALAGFIGEGPPPVAIGFSSQVGRDREGLTAVVRDAVALAGVRAVVLSGFGAVDAIDSRDLLVVDAVPHDWLFARVAAVAHHGGSGTTGSALWAGRPAFAVPFGYDQPLWGERLHALGVGPAPLPAATLTAPALAAALRSATGTESMRTRAAALGAIIRREDGLGTAVRLLHGLTGTRRP
ncbi:MAG: glycosyltransferase [Vicinamibacterales bacterium]